ncbi:MAG: TerB family tellurite resistance protein [Bernardetiaceae bacterium]|nr:TerB family tellurite resistance protein [Bernardetiaceae bacterium]
MNPDKERLYDAFGTLIYAVAKADGLVQESETNALNNILVQHPWASQIKWSFDYELKRETDVKTAYLKAIDVCAELGPSDEYDFFIEVLAEVARASDGIDENEAEIIQNFKKDFEIRYALIQKHRNPNWEFE